MLAAPVPSTLEGSVFTRETWEAGWGGLKHQSGIFKVPGTQRGPRDD